MKHAPFRALALILSLLLLALPLCAQAEEAGPVLNMFTFFVDNISYTTDGEKTEVPVAFEMSVGMDVKSLDELRAALLINLTSANSTASIMGSIENGEVRARVSGVDTGILMPYGDALDAVIIDSLLMGLTYDQISAETREALTDYLALLEETMLLPAEADSAESVLEIFFPTDLWREDYEKYPALMNAEPAGDEEITLFGTTYTAHKYTYSFSRITGEEYDAYFKAYDEHFYGGETELDKAYAALEELVWADFEALYGETDSGYNPDDVWTDNGTVTDGSSLSEWNEEQPDDITYSIEGTIWQVDEVMGMVETYTATMHEPDGDTVETYAYSDMFTGSAVRTETISTTKDSYGNTTTASEASSYSFTENGDLYIDGYVVSEFDYPDYDYSGTMSIEYSVETAGDRMTVDVQVSESGSDPTLEILPVFTAIHGDFTASYDEETAEPDALSGTLSVSTTGTGAETLVTLDMGITMGTMPEGELIPLPEQVINPMEAGDDALNAFAEQIFNMFMQFAASLAPAPEAPPTIGGSLLPG